MLGNKFLDDNTYTNKTWADVSGISVQEVHLMEVEFLSNMRYGLFASAAEWEEWHVKLTKFGNWIDQARRNEILARPPALHSSASLPPALPSPPVSNHPSPPYHAALSPNSARIVHTPLLLPQVSSASVSPIGPLPELDFRSGRKRSWDGGIQEPPSKRSATTQNYTPSAQPPSLPPASMTGPPPLVNNVPRLPLPSLSIPAPQAPYHAHNIPQLPLPGGRAMSLVFPPTQWSQPPNSTSVPGPALPPVTQPLNNSFPDRSRQLSPLPVGSNNNSPTSGTIPSGQTQNQSMLSPSYFLQQRSSPYRPVRGVKTLLVPPPSGTLMHQPRSIGPEQMQYQPLWRPSERRAGHVPYVNHEAWPENHQFNHWPPALQQVSHH